MGNRCQAHSTLTHRIATPNVSDISVKTNATSLADVFESTCCIDVTDVTEVDDGIDQNYVWEGKIGATESLTEVTHDSGVTDVSDALEEKLTYPT